MKLLHILMILLVAFSVIACGGSDDHDAMDGDSMEGDSMEGDAMEKEPGETAPAEPAAPSADPVEDPVEANVPAPSGDDVMILGRSGFDPEEVRVAVGGTVTWKVDAQGTSKIISRQPNSEDIQSPVLKDGDTFEHTFNTAGEYEFTNVVFGKYMTVIVE